jgi:hypothetical protein
VEIKGAAAWLAALEAETGRALATEKRGPKPRVVAEEQPGQFSTVSP